MKCLYCGSEQLFTANSRAVSDGRETWRRKKCQTCGKTFTTKEKSDLSGLVIIKRSGTKRRYVRVKLFCGIYNAALETKGIDRGDAALMSEEITELVEKKIIDMGKKEITTRWLARLVAETLLEEEPNLFLAYLSYFNIMKDAVKSQQFSKKYWRGFIKKAVG